MGYHTVMKGGPGRAANYREFMLDSTSDKSNLPTSVRNANGDVAGPDSKAFTRDYEHLYVLGTDDVWREV